MTDNLITFSIFNEFVLFRIKYPTFFEHEVYIELKFRHFNCEENLLSFSNDSRWLKLPSGTCWLKSSDTYLTRLNSNSFLKMVLIFW
jgi:hypothetical protein